MQAVHDQQTAPTETHWWRVGRRKLLRRLLDRFVGKDAKRKILEVGCSTGADLAMLQDFGTVDAMEVDAPAVAYCRMRYPDIRVYDGGIPDPLRDTYDVICLFDVLEHIEDEDGALEWIDDHLVPGGVLLVTVSSDDFTTPQGKEPAKRVRRYTRAALEAFLARRFEVAYSSYFNTHLFPALAVARQFRRLLHLDGGAAGKAPAGRGICNRVLQAVFASERLWLPAVKLPFGVSVFAAAHKAKAS